MLAELKTFVAVVQSGTFTAAGTRVGLSQAAVSGHIQRLEERLGFALFDRVGRTARLNEAGAQAFERALHILAEIDALATGQLARARRSIRIGSITSVQESVVAAAIASLRCEAPHLLIRIVPGVSLQLFAQLGEGELALVIIIKPPFPLTRDLAWTPLIREPFMLAVPASEREASWRAILESRPFIKYDRVSFGGRQVEGFLRRSGLRVEEVVELDDIRGAMSLVRAGVGVSLLPIGLGNQPGEGIRLVPLDSGTFYREIGIVTRVHSSNDADLAALRDSLLGAATLFA